MEVTALILASRYKRVMVRSAPRVDKPIRFRRRLVESMNLMLIPRHNPKPYLAKWADEGGNALYYPHIQKTEEIPEHHAQLISECPFDKKLYEIATKHTKDVTVIFQPPNWNQHKARLMDIHPPSLICEKVFKMIVSDKATDKFADLVGMPHGSNVADDGDIIRCLGLTRPMFRYARRTLMKKERYKRIAQVAPRVPPDAYELQAMYRYIEQEAIPGPDGSRYIIERELAKCAKFWRTIFTMLIRRGHIDMVDMLGVYDMRDLEPDWVAIDERSERAKRDLKIMTDMVEKAPTYA